eukprot:TRINITY_DN3058_c0_g1_i10.p1 TRINITY_DN3058_c0_g1~~TRINITY_DN3058_c0_g1_i10.p1  ORF type:complete len:576 (-),score=63.92 TRINITY_DN3058_c0_g1_i10:11-1588(-)
MKCSNQFTCCQRRHHCRYCGSVACGSCSGQKIDHERACDDCYYRDQLLHQRALTLAASPNLSQVHALSPVVQRVLKGKKVQPPQTSSRKPLQEFRDPGSVLESPRINRSIANLQTIYGASTHERERVKPPQIASPILSPRLRELKQAAAAVSAAPSVEKKVMIVVDPFSTGAVLAAEILSRGAKVVRVFSAEFPDHLLNLILDGIKVEFINTIQHKGDLDETVKKIKQLKLGDNLIGCTPGCETGVELADAISEALGLRTNGTQLSDTRRNKYLMGEQVRRAGVRAVQQARVRSLEEINQFLKRFSGSEFKCVIKPVAAAGSDGVYFCKNREDVYAKFKKLYGATNVLGATNTECVIQEYLEGKEYVVDTVSRDGKHKVVAVWEYDKRPTNGAPFVYYCLRLQSATDPKVKELIHYQFKVLDALGIKNGAGHGEVMYTPTGPCLVEVGARPHGGEGSFVPLVNKVFKTSQVKAVTDIYLDVDAWNATPEVPVLDNVFGLQIYLISQIGRAVQQECRDRSRMPSSA